ncbi:MAG TPA: helix-turn-helix domain-containing protein [Dehalococcoidia bacterium]|nr:helix-turn-helix domain-containing protein [Dehalococcoidia bacterium]
MTEAKRVYGSPWDGASVRALRGHLALTQDGLAEELGVRQQTVSEWETGQYRPRGASAKLLSMVAERAGFEYGTGAGRAAGQRGRTGAGARRTREVKLGSMEGMGASVKGWRDARVMLSCSLAPVLTTLRLSMRA